MFSHNIQNVSFSGFLFWTKQKVQASFAEYIMFFKMCMGLIFHDKKGNESYLFGLAKKLTFLSIDTSNGNGKGQDSNGKGEMSHPFCPLPLPLSVMVTGQDSNVTGQNLINMSV